MPPHVVSSLLRSSFIVLLVVPKNLHLLLLSDEHFVKKCFSVSGVFSPQFSNVGVVNSTYSEKNSKQIFFYKYQC